MREARTLGELLVAAESRHLRHYITGVGRRIDGDSSGADVPGAGKTAVPERGTRQLPPTSRAVDRR
jgi:hypothetical protein